MSTVYNSIDSFCKKSKIPIPPIEQRKLIGQKVIEAWFNPKNLLNKKHALHKHTFVEIEGVPLVVISYPKAFLPVIDSIVHISLKKETFNKKEFINNKFLKENLNRENNLPTPQSYPRAIFKPPPKTPRKRIENTQDSKRFAPQNKPIYSTKKTN